MNNAYYLLSKEQIEIKRFHICTWEFPNESSYLEFGFEFPYDCIKNDSLSLLLSAPFCLKNESVSSLSVNLSDRDNSRFIFNDVVSGIDNVGEDSRDGCIIKFENRGCLTVLPCDIGVSRELISFSIKKPKKYEGNLYIRALVNISDNPVAIKKSGIAQTSYIYDIKINETRNLPQSIYDLKKRDDLNICSVEKVFCLHAIPDNFVFTFVDSTKLKSIRKLESSAFQHYLPQIKGISQDCYNIVFLKDSGKESYSFFSTCTEETIGSKQIALAVGVNILCSLLFAIASFRFVKNPAIAWYRQIPLEYWGAFGVLVLLCIYLFTPLKKKF